MLILFCVAFFLGSNPYWAGRIYGLYVHFMTVAPEGSAESGSLEAGDLTCDPWFTIYVYPLHHGGNFTGSLSWT